MDADLTSCKHVSTGKQVKPCSSLCLQEIAYDFNVGKCSGQECSNPVNGRPKRIGTKIKSGMLTIQGPPASGFDGDTIKKPTSKEKNLLIVGENGLKKGTWKRAQIKPRSDGRLLLQWAMQYLEEYRTAVDLIPIAQVSVQHVQRWIPPPVPGFKFNVDGAAFAELNFVGV
ncbi:hypothetical protein CFP56_039094 [Quercus suber]|uniref:Uncharacterized protein n=1 Tax=Quercus suber TaxID=58331 RepID=A0AAW0LNC2_QUESU